jgi:hypothetical protein
MTYGDSCGVGRRSSPGSAGKSRTGPIGLAIAITQLLGSPGGAHAETRFSYGRINPSEKIAVVRDSFNRPCISLKGEFIRHYSPIDVSDQNLRAENACGKAIKVKACLVGHMRCAEFLLRPHEKRQIVFGVTPSTPAPPLLRFDFITHEVF